GVYKLNSKTALIQTLDFLTPVTDSPYEFGQIAAANSLSDVYAMGGEPKTVMNIVCFPVCDLEESVLAETLRGGLDKINESGAVLVGGHSVDDPEFKYGLSVTGIVHPDQVLTNAGGEKGDVVILTKPVGTGIMSTAIKAKLATKENIKESVAVMSMLNKIAARVMSKFTINACTDVTGFGLAGHLLEVAKASKKKIVLFTEKVPVLKGVHDFAKMGMVPAGAHKNRKFFEELTCIDTGIDRAVVDLMFDPQTSGGLLICLNKKDARALKEKMKDNGRDAWIIGEIDHDCETGFLSVI
ncbi:MAG: selenide, water dikinase SelD, partial [Deltaproteobacteria bacterium]|nr:selenide, water dikinase SelD [Deltaproteobacteria bacterium]